MGHKWKYDSPSLPYYRTCKKCGKKQHINILLSYTELFSPYIWEDILG